MLSWSGHESGDEVDLGALGEVRVTALPAVEQALHAFAGAAAGDDEVALDAARRALVELAGDAAMVDAAAVAANFEMMTRLADGTGARFPDDRAEGNEPIATAMGMREVVSRR